jgi:hypothetical protein
MTLQYEFWDDTVGADMLWQSAPDLADDLGHELLKLKTIKLELITRDQGWLSAEVEMVIGNIYDVARTLRKNKTEDRIEYREADWEVELSA